MLRSRSAINSAVFSRRLWLLNAYKQTPQAVARQARRILYGEHKPIYHPQQDVGDRLLIINSKEIKVHGNIGNFAIFIVFWNHIWICIIRIFIILFFQFAFSELFVGSMILTPEQRCFGSSLLFCKGRQPSCNKGVSEFHLRTVHARLLKARANDYNLLLELRSFHREIRTFG